MKPGFRDRAKLADQKVIFIDFREFAYESSILIDKTTILPQMELIKMDSWLLTEAGWANFDPSAFQ